MAFLPLSIDPQFVGSGNIVGASILSALSHGAGAKYSSMSIAGIHPRSGIIIAEERSFQFMPETINDSIEIGWSFKEVTGASASLAEWTSNGGRTISFEVPVMRTMLYDEDQPEFLFLKSSGNDTSQRQYNEDVNCFIKYCRSLCYPILGDGGIVLSPPIVALNVPNMKLGTDGASDIFYGAMTECDVTYEKTFQNGKVTIAKLSLGFKEVIQRKDKEPYQFKYFEDIYSASKTQNNARASTKAISGF